MSLPNEFSSVLNISHDSSRKGYRVIASLDQQFKLSVYVTPPGICIHASKSYHQSRSMIFMQCTNCNKSSSGYVCVGRLRPNKTKRSITRLHQEGSVDDCFLCIQQGVFIGNDNEMYVVYNKLIPPINISLSEIIQWSSTNISFVEKVFNHRNCVSLATEMEFVYLNQIAGPKLPDDHREESSISVNSEVFVEMRKTPDVWTNRYTDQLTAKLPIIKSFPMLWKPGHSMEKKKKKERICHDTDATVFDVLGLEPLQSRCRQETAVYLCRPRPQLISKDYNDIGCLMEIYPFNESPYLMFLELTIAQQHHVNELADKNEPMDESLYNKMLLLFQKESKRPLILLYKLTINNNTTSNTMISQLHDVNDIPTGHGIVQLTGNIWKQVLPNNRNGVLDVNNGLVVQQIFDWPFKKQIQDKHIHLLRMCYPVGTPRCMTHITTRWYQSLLERSTPQCSASLGSHSTTKIYHHQWNSSTMNTSYTPSTASIINSLKQEAAVAQFSGGNIISPFELAITGITPFELYSSCLATAGFSNTRHRDVNDVMSLDDTECWLSTLQEDSGDQRVNLLKEEYILNLRHCMSNLSTNEVPVESTCAWTLVKKDNEIYLYRQFFANLTCGVALDISSTGFENADQVGSTFMGAFFEHCTTRPIWLNKTDRTISFNQPPGSNNYVFAWGNHRGWNSMHQYVQYICQCD